MAEKTRCEICDRNFPNEDAFKMHNSAKHSAIAVSKKSNNKSFVYFVVIFVLLFAGIYLYFSSLSNGSSQNLNNNGVQDDVQKIILSMKNYNYYPNTINVKEGMPVEITLDDSVGGCFRSFNIRDLGVSKYSSGPSDKIVFTPNKKGSFEFACGMRMGYGTIIIE